VLTFNHKIAAITIYYIVTAISIADVFLGDLPSLIVYILHTLSGIRSGMKKLITSRKLAAACVSSRKEIVKILSRKLVVLKKPKSEKIAVERSFSRQINQRESAKSISNQLCLKISSLQMQFQKKAAIRVSGI
jgi:hypothetical protein